MELRNLNDQCAALQSKINKKLELLLCYHTYKEFLDDLNPNKEVEAEKRAEKLAEKQRQVNQQKSFDSQAYNQRRGTKVDNSKSIPAQGRAALNSHGDPSMSAAAQFEVEYPEKLKHIFEEDSDDHVYELPFKHASDLNDHFTQLEERNLKLIG